MGRDIYAKKCKKCHGASGKADTKMGKKHEIADATAPGWDKKWSLAKVIKIVTHGKPDSKMKAFGSKLTKEEIEAVSRYMRSL